MSNDRGRRGGSRASIFSFIGLGLVGLFQKLGLSFSVVFFDRLAASEADFSVPEGVYSLFKTRLAVILVQPANSALHMTVDCTYYGLPYL